MTTVIKKINGVSFANIKKFSGKIKTSIKKVAGISRGHQYWRFYQTSIVTPTYAHSPRLCELKWVDGNGVTITPTTSAYGGTWLAGTPATTLPFDGITNTIDQGWIHNNDAWISAYFAIPRLFSSFGAFTSYSGARGGNFAIQYSDDGTNWTTITTWTFVSNAGTGWYTVSL